MSVAAHAVHAEQPSPESRPRRLTYREFQQAAQAGVFRPDERLELLDGVLYEKVWADPAPGADPYADAVAEARPRRWTVSELEQAARWGVFGPDERLELIQGEIIEKVSPQGIKHATSVKKVTRVLALLVGEAHHLIVQVPILLTENNEPEPDVAVIRGGIEDYEHRHPDARDAALVVEVSDASAAYDRDRKARMYAEFGVREYWLLNIPQRRLEVHRDPTPDGYGTVTRHDERSAARSLFAPESEVFVSDLLPKV